MEKYIDQIKGFFYGAILYLQMDEEVTLILFALISLNMIFGAIKASILPELTFKKQIFWQGFFKKILMLFAIMVLALVARGVGFEDFKILVVNVMKVMVLSQGISIYYSIRSIYDRKHYKSDDFISVLLAKIGDILVKYTEKILKFFEDSTKCF
jgi:small basic protein